MPTLITGEQLIVGPARHRVPDGAVLVDGDTITAAGPRATLAAQALDATHLDFPGATLLPGLFNCHVHLAFSVGPGALTAVQNETDNERLLAAMTDRARQLLEAGVTTARDLGDRDRLAARLRDTIAAGHTLGPRLLTATAPLTPTGGHCWFLGGAIDNTDDPNALRAAVRRTAEAGADVVKVMASGGGATPGGAAMWESQFTTEQLQILVDEAHRLGLPVAAHAHGTDSIRSAVTARVDTLEHCTWMGEDKAFTPRADISDLVDQIATAHIPVCPAHACNWDLFARMRGPDDATELLSRLRWLADRGVTLIAGTDAGLAAFTDLGVPRLTNWGFTPEEVLDMATVHPAAALGLATTTGTLHPGYSADILAVHGDPLSDLDALTRIEMVMTRGRVHYPAHA